MPEKRGFLNHEGGEKAVIPENELMFHTLVLGRTGTGKSNLLKILFNCISRDDNSNIILVDFHGTLSREIICMNHGKRLVFISPGDPKSNEFKTRLNVLKGSNLSPVITISSGPFPYFLRLSFTESSYFFMSIFKFSIMSTYFHRSPGSIAGRAIICLNKGVSLTMRAEKKLLSRKMN